MLYLQRIIINNKYKNENKQINQHAICAAAYVARLDGNIM
jgi:hypothetical protein